MPTSPQRLFRKLTSQFKYDGRIEQIKQWPRKQNSAGLVCIKHVVYLLTFMLREKQVIYEVVEWNKV